MASQGARLSFNDIRPSHRACFFFVFFKRFLLGTVLVVILEQDRTTVEANSTPPTTLVFYQHEEVGINIVTITNSSLGFLSVADVPLTETADPASTEVGRWYGIGSTVTPSTTIYVSQDYHIQWSAKNLSGTFVIQSAVTVTLPVRELVIVGGTGSFYLARGYSLATYVSGNYTTANHTLRIEAHFHFSCGSCT